MNEWMNEWMKMDLVVLDFFAAETLRMFFQDVSLACRQ